MVTPRDMIEQLLLILLVSVVSLFVPLYLIGATTTLGMLTSYYLGRYHERRGRRRRLAQMDDEVARARERRRQRIDERNYN